VRSLAFILLFLTGAAAAQTPGLWLMGNAPGTVNSLTLALSQDGAVAAGYSVPGGGSTPLPGFTWTRSGGRYDFGLEPNMPEGTPAYGLSSDGNTIVGFMGGPGPDRAYRRVGNGPLQDLGSGGYQYSRASGVSGDGSIVVGHGQTVSGGSGQALRWTAQTGFQGLGWLPGDGYSEALAISRDGTTIVGDSGDSVNRPFVWRQGTGMQPLPPLAGGSVAFSSARGVNADGSVIVGNADIPGGGNYHAVRWTAAGALDLGALSGHPNTLAFAVSDDGLVIGGGADSATGPLAFLWTPATGMLALPDYLSMHGVTVPAGWRPAGVYAVSGDGRTFAGAAWNASGVIQGFVATIPAPSGAAVLFVSALFGAHRRRGWFWGASRSILRS
jgi:probable HAF family extracellular repeat protein